MLAGVRPALLPASQALLSSGDSADSGGLQLQPVAPLQQERLCLGQLTPSVRSVLPFSPWPVIYGIN